MSGTFVRSVLTHREQDAYFNDIIQQIIDGFNSSDRTPTLASMYPSIQRPSQVSSPTDSTPCEEDNRDDEDEGYTAILNTIISDDKSDIVEGEQVVPNINSSETMNEYCEGISPPVHMAVFRKEIQSIVSEFDTNPFLDYTDRKKMDDLAVMTMINIETEMQNLTITSSAEHIDKANSYLVELICKWEDLRGNSYPTIL